MAQKDKKDYERILAYNPHYDPANIVYDNGRQILKTPNLDQIGRGVDVRTEEDEHGFFRGLFVNDLESELED